MPITLAKIASNVSSVTLQFGEDTVTVHYYPGRVTEKLFAELNAFSSMTEETMMPSFKAFNETLSNLIKSWDVYEDEAETIMYPLDPVRLAELPMMFRIQIVSAITSDIRPESLAPQA